MQTLIVFASVFIATVYSICTGSKYWNPLNNACVNQCPWESPNLYYADSSTNECVLTCPTTPSYYANDFTQTCDATCPWNPTKTFYDNYYRRCVLNCPSSPPYYAYDAGSSGTCVRYCPAGTYSLDSNRTCVTTCPVNYYINYTLNVVQYQCVAVCPENTFLNQSNKQCLNATACPSGYYGDPINNICTNNCPLNASVQLYADTNPNVKLCVYICPNNFYRQNSTRSCVSQCTSSNFFIDYINLICVSTCPNGTFAYMNNTCQPKCPSPYYADPNLHICNTTCASGFRDPTTNFCVVQCPPGYFGDASAGNNCSKICSNASEFGNPVNRLCVAKASCTSPYIFADNFTRQCVTLCPQSQSTYGVTTSNSCQLNCPWAAGGYYFKDPSTQTCVLNCPANPSYFADNSSKSCLQSCPPSYYAVVSSRTCQTSCPNNYYKNLVTRVCVSTCSIDPVITYYIAVNSTASQCVSNCSGVTGVTGVYLADPTTLTCINNASTMCPTFPSLFADYDRSVCVSSCPVNRYAHTVTRQCQTSCSGIYLMDNSTWRCVTVCPTNPSLFADWTTNYCVSYCPPTYFADNSTRECLQTCNQTVGYLAYTPLRLCVLVCPNNTYSYAGTCVTTCPNTTAPFYYIDATTKSCVTTCPDYYFRDDNLGKCVQAGGCSLSYLADYTARTCLINCTSTDTTYRDNTTMSCVTQCPFGYFGDYSVTNDKKCVIACPPSYYADNSTWTCTLKCPTYPSYYADLGSRICVSNCRVDLDQFAEDIDRTCVLQCPSGTYADIYTRKCLINCLLQPSTYMFVNGTERVCLLKCPIGYFADNSTRECVTGCPSNPNYFADWLSSTCLTLCPQTETTIYYADTLTRTCVDTCPNLNITNNGVTTHYQTFRDTVLRVCIAVCSGNQFADNSTGNCTQTCPAFPDMFGQMSIKTCVYRCNATQDTWAENITRLCVQQCPAGSFADNFTQRCTAKCPVSQLTYGDFSTHRCVLRCPSYPSLWADNVTQTCVQVCPGYTYGAPVTRVCQAPKNCSSGYFADNFTKTCVQQCPATQSGYAQNNTQRCLKKCPVGSFADNSTYRCVQECPSTPSYFGYKQKCQAFCPDNTYADSPTRLCVNSSSCTGDTWGDPTSKKCVSTCPYNYYSDQRTTTKLCTQKCPSGYFADDLTKSCVSICPQTNKTYGTNATRKCVEVCPKNEFAQNTTRLCVSNCPDNSYADANVRVCVAVCSATPNLYGVPGPNTCVETCPSNPDLYAQNSTRMCTPTCLFSESTFADRLTRRCVLTCPVSEFTYADNQTRRCQPNCTYDPTPGGVKTYADNSTLTCVATCPSLPAYFADISTGFPLCVPNCPNNTVPRIFANNISRICIPLCPAANYYYSSNTTGQCVIFCPGGYFADNQTQACVSRCPGRYGTAPVVDTFGYELDRTCVIGCVSPYFSQNSSRLCTIGCPQLEYADTTLRRCVAACDGQRREYADNSTNKCVQTCPTLPDTFADNSTYVCVHPCPITPGIDYNCIDSCPLGTWACNITRECKAICSTVQPKQYADNYTGRCVKYCPRNLDTYADNISLSCVAFCPNLTNGVMTYADDSTKRCVTVCPSSPWTYAENITQTCVFRCPADSFGQNTTRQCVDECRHWFTFADNSTTFCVTTCPENSFAENASMRCVAQCPKGSYADNSTWRCVAQCPLNPALYGDVTTAVCVINCPNNYYGDDSSRVCTLVCPVTPGIFFAYEPTHRCLQNCLYPYFGQPNTTYSTYGSCQTYCYTGQYKNMTTHRCEQCFSVCTQCVSLLGCTTCINDYYLYNGTCLSGCSSGTGNGCKSACPYNIITGTITYADPVSSSCVQICPVKANGGSYGYNATLKCIDVCPINYYASNVTRRCELCVDGCNNCTGPTTCFSCFDNYTFSNNLCVKKCSYTLPFYYKSTCVGSCFDGTYLMSDKITCGECSSTCMTCSLIASNCTKCFGAYLYNYNCVSKCPNNYYADGNLACQVCTASVSQCNVAALTYTLQSKTEGKKLYGLLTFSRAVTMDTSNIKKICNISLPIPSSQYTWNATQLTQIIYRIDIFTSVSLKQMSLSLTFIDPSLVIDSAGSTLSATTISAPLPTYDYIPPSVQASTASISSVSSILSWISLVIMLLLIFKGSYGLLLTSEVFQMVYFHYFLNQTLPYNFSSFLLNLKYLNFQFLPNPLSSTFPVNFLSPATPTNYVQAITDTTFFISCGHYFLVLGFYIAWAILIALLKNKSLMKWDRLRRFARGVFQRRIRFGAINQGLWFCYISFMFFGIWQFKDLQTTTGWNIANIAIAAFFVGICLLLTGWVIYLSMKYRDNPAAIPKKHQFILGEDSHIPFEMALRHIRKLLFCVFLAIGKIQTQIMAIMGANFMVLAYYLFYKPAKSRLSNWINILIEMCYIGLQITMMSFVNAVKPSTDAKLTYGTAMMAFCITALILIVIWLVWQFMLFLYDFKFVRDIIQETKLANQIYPEQDNLKIQLDKQYEKDQIIPQESISDQGSYQMEEDTIEGIEKQYNDVVHYVEEKELEKKGKDHKKGKKINRQDTSEAIIQSESNEPRLISSRASSRMLFADLNVEDIE